MEGEMDIEVQLQEDEALDIPDCDCEDAIHWCYDLSRWIYCPKFYPSQLGLHVLTSKLPNEFKDRPPAILPTEARPGSEEKIKIMQRRVASGRNPFHPQDITLKQIEDQENLVPLDAGNGRSGREEEEF